MFPYQNSELTPEARAKDLLSRLTTKEKIAQMTLHRMEDKNFDPVAFDERNPDGIGSTYHTLDLNPKEINAMQRHVMENSRLGIPLYVMGESLHGFMCNGATVFPQSIGLGATFDEALIHDMAKIIGKEVRSTGVHETYAPNLDLSREPRWGRVEENYGEDPYLTARLGVQYITGIQSQGVAASPKHYIAHGSPESGMNISPVHAGEREVRETMMKPFAAAFMKAKAMSVMPAYSELDGCAIHASRHWCTEVLREEFGFEGWAVSDWGAIHRIQLDHHQAATEFEAGKLALHAGIDIEAPNTHGFGPELAEAADKDPEIMKEVDLAVYRILLGKFRLGLFENPYADENATKKFRSKKALALSEKAALESCVLLKNNGILPLDAKKYKKIALIGPGAKFLQLGDYTCPAADSYSVTVYDALKEKLGRNLLYAQGSSIAFSNAKALTEAYETAAKADAVILVLSSNSCHYGREDWGDTNIFANKGLPTVNCGETFDVDSLDFPEAQLKLLKKVASAKKPLVVLSMTGRPQLMAPVEKYADAILQIWYPGERGGIAVTKLLYGEENPSGKLPITFPRTDGQIPCFYNYKASKKIIENRIGSPKAPSRRYVFGTPVPQYEFGFGLSYTTFAYSNLKVKAFGGTNFEATVTVTNTGEREGTETVLMFITDEYCRITPFAKQLRGFERVKLLPGQKKRVHFTIDFNDLSFVNEAYKPEVEPGTFLCAIGTETARFEVK